MQPWIAIVIIVVLLVVVWRLLSDRRKRPATPLQEADRQLLETHVLFYQRLNAADKARFEKKVADFLSGIRIEGVGVTVEELDRVLVAASAVIPIFGFADWEYRNLTTVLLYPDSFNEAFEQTGKERFIMGMVGSGYMNGQMILSQHALRAGFDIRSDKSNTGIHEFVHLLDKSDGAVDGIPENLLAHQYTIPWLDMMRQNIEAIKERESDINPYGATNKGEFFAVASEYFFERPDLLQHKHPELYEMMKRIFHQQPAG